MWLSSRLLRLSCMGCMRIEGHISWMPLWVTENDSQHAPSMESWLDHLYYAGVNLDKLSLYVRPS